MAREPGRPPPLARIATRVATGGLLLAVAFAPIALGSVHTWALGVLVLLLSCALAALVVAVVAGARPPSPPPLPALLLVALAGIGAFQTITFPRATLSLIASARTAALDELAPIPADVGLAGAATALAALADLRNAAPISYQLDTTATEVVRILVYLAAFITAALLLERRSDIRRLATVVSAVCGSLAVLGLVLQYRSEPRLLGYFTPPPGASTFASYVNRNHFAGLMELALPLAVALAIAPLLERRREPVQRWFEGLLGLGTATAMAVALLSTQSRAALLGALSGILVLTAALVSLKRTRSSAWVAAVGVVGLIVFAVVLDQGWAFARLTSGSQRVFTRFRATQFDLGTRAAIWRGALAMTAAHPGIGVGLGAFATPFVAFEPEGVAAYQPHAESDYLTLLAESGATGGVLVLLLSVAIARRLWSVIRSARARADIDDRHAEQWLWLAGSGAGIIALLVHGFFDINLHVTANGLLFWVLVAIASTRAPSTQRTRPRVVAAAAFVTLASLVATAPSLLHAARADALYQQARALHWRDPSSDAEVALLQRATRLDPTRAAIHLRLGTRLAHQVLVSPDSAETPELRDAFLHLGQAARLWPSDVNARFELGWLTAAWAQRQGPAHDPLVQWGLEVMRIAAEAKPGAIGLRIRYGLFLVFLASDRTVEGLGVLRETIRSHPRQLDNVLSVLEVRLPRFLVSHAVPDVAEFRYRYGRRLEGTSCEDAIAEYERAIALATPFPERSDDVRRLVVTRLDALQLPERALPLWNQLLERSPLDPELLRGSSVALLNLRLIDDATRNLEQALAATPRDDRQARRLTQDVLGRVYYTRRDCGRAREHLEDTQEHLGLYLRGSCELAAGDLQKARASFAHLLELNPLNDRAKSQLGVVERRMAEALR